MRLARVLAPAAVAVVLLAGCGGGNDGSAAPTPSSTAPASNGIADQTAEEILAAATEALKKAGSYQIKGEAVDDGDKLSMDLRIAGDDLAGTIGMGKSSFELLLVGGQPYFKADATFWKQVAGPEGAGMAKLIGDRWVKVGKDDDNFKGLFDLADTQKMLKPDGTVVKGEVKEIDAGPAIALVDDEDKGTLYVATTGEPYPLLIEGSDGDVVISGFGESFPEIKKPAEDEVLDFSEFASGS
ncbi:lipoprotein [Micromonospora qiuiae]|uniref:Lipoprotein n=1 Tax=Micromonospora qiuiae TaxID=502268 RepID=A0ABQ4J4R8_9ACTN|nr:hypothetical protein [Micromonospora qiuiae]GIJ25154.1 lipoprotein [Micromonospora qiuiae]